MCIFEEEKKQIDMTFQEVLNTRNEKGIIQLSNDSANWYAISRGNTHMITFYNEDTEYKFYKTEK